ncbi:hypothetical protein DFH29DRAFT_894800 [Suillus ampliporus]|nr:hypothetical protein DFH29DRAFT_894800 [Suillus ampliporus]
MHFSWVEDLSKIIAVRLRRPAKNRRTQHNSAATDHKSDGSIPADIPANVSSARYSVSPAREASDMVQLALPLVQAFTGIIPLVGPPMKAAIGGLLEILQAIDRRNQNRADLDGLKLRLHRLSGHLCNAPPARDPLEQSRRDSLVSMLQETSAQLTKLHKRCLAYTSVTQAIAGCSSQIDRYLADYSLSSQMQSQHDRHEVLTRLQRQREEHQRHHEENQKRLMEIQRLIICAGPTATQLAGTVTLVDATGHEHAIPINFCTSFQQFKMMLRVLFERDSLEAHIQRRYIMEGQYDLCIDQGTQVTQLTSRGWSNIEAGTKIVMRVIIEQLMTLFEVSYKCHFCDARICKRRFQISCVPPSAKKSTRSCNIDSFHKIEPEIRNFHVQQIVVCDLIL